MHLMKIFSFSVIKSFDKCQPEETSMVQKFLTGSKFLKSLCWGPMGRNCALNQGLTNYGYLFLVEHSCRKVFTYCQWLFSSWDSKNDSIPHPPSLKCLLSNPLIFSPSKYLLYCYLSLLASTTWKGRLKYTTRSTILQ